MPCGAALRVWHTAIATRPISMWASSPSREIMSSQTRRMCSVKSNGMGGPSPACASGLGGFGAFVAEGGLLAPLDLAIADADEFQDCPRAGVAQAGLGQLDHARVAAAAVAES